MKTMTRGMARMARLVPADSTQLPLVKAIDTMCCYCSRLRLADGSWSTDDEDSSHQVSHGICENCLKMFHPEIELGE